MLSKEQLQDAAKCEDKCMFPDKNDTQICGMHDVGFRKRDCVEHTAKTALELMEENEKLKEMLAECADKILLGDGIPCKGIFGHEEDME